MWWCGTFGSDNNNKENIEHLGKAVKGTFVDVALYVYS